jgi:excisionase family DNA binding protein
MTAHTTTPIRRRNNASGQHSTPVAATETTAGSRLLAVEDVSALLGVSPALVYALVRRGELPAVRIGERYVRFRAQALQDWIAEQESTTPRGTR